jgi:hypothetical protein
MATDAKFRWFEAMSHDGLIPLAQRAIIGYCGIRYAMESQGFVIKVTQQTIADNLGVSRKTVNVAFGTAARHGWLMKKAVHKPGTGNHGADTWALALPKWCNPDDTPEPEWSNGIDTPLESGVTESAEWCNPNGQSGVTESAEWCNPANASTRENDVPKGINQGFEEGFLYQGVTAAGGASADDDPFDVFDDEPTGPTCSHPGCRKTATKDDLCAQHWATRNWRRSS